MKLWNKLKNNTLLLLGCTLENQYGHTVEMGRNFKQRWSNPKRRKPYSLDDDRWRVKQM